jgi:hypothetical protein
VRWLVLGVSSSCLALEGPSVELQCTECADDEACDPEFGCTRICNDDAPCVDGSLVCALGSCEEPCRASDCDKHLGCDRELNRCHSVCFKDDECADGFRCCTERRFPDECSRLSSCF